MKLKSFGCSFIFGSDLSDNPDQAILINPTGRFSRLTWPALIANKLQLEYECYARPGAGNLQIAERVLNECDNSSDLFVISWTYIDRFDYVGSNDTWQPWRTLTPGNNDSLSTTYYQYLHSEYRDKLSTLIYVKTVIDTLKQKNINFVMTYMDELMFDQRWHVTPAITTLQDYIKPYTSTFEGQTFLTWSRAQGYLESSKWHPLEQAHRAASDLMIRAFDKQKTNGPAH